MPKYHNSVMKAIRDYCKSCAECDAEIRYCQLTDCSLWRFRMGQGPRALEKKRPELLDPEYIKRVAAERAAKGR